MHKIDDVNSILNAVNEIILKPKKIKTNVINDQKFFPKLDQDLQISPDVDRLILEAEEYKKKLILKPLQVNLTQNKNDIITPKNYNKTLEEDNSQIITRLHAKIKNLENELRNTETNQKKIVIKDKTFNDKKKSKTFFNFRNTEVLKDEVVKSLKIQDSSIEILNKKVEIFKETEEKLRLRIIDLELDKTILLKEKEKFYEFKNYSNYINHTKEKLKSIYKQVEKQKKIFINLKNYSVKTERETEFFKENYEKSIIENKVIKRRLAIAKEQIVIYESNKLDLLSSINQLNEILSKTNIATNISPIKKSQEENTSTKKKKTTSTE